jgi:hypothetical protein
LRRNLNTQQRKKINYDFSENINVRDVDDDHDLDKEFEQFLNSIGENTPKTF